MSAAPPAGVTDGFPPRWNDAAIGREGYRPHLDGLRAFAVYLVVLFHAGSASFVGGFIGVDVFFVLSGYLVTQLLWRDLAAVGAIRVGRFYARRVRRILPAATATLTVTALIYASIASPSEVAAAAGGFKAAFLFVANWFFIHRSTAYFGGEIAESPVLHFWSLAVEEQFYLLWPLILGAIFAAGRRWAAAPLPVVRMAVAGGIAASLLWALALRTAHPLHAYFGTDARAYQLLAGAYLALTPGLIGRLHRSGARARWLAPAALAGLVIVSSSLVPLDPTIRGVLATVLSCLAIMAVEAADGGPTRRLLASGPLVYLGRISYGTYLWQWPVILVISVTVSITVPATVALTILIASALASLSFELLENPIRRSSFLDARGRSVIAAGLAAGAVAAFVLMPAILDPSRTTSRAARAVHAGGTPIPANLDLDRARFSALPRPPICIGKPASACTVVQGSGAHLLLIGDSHARAFMPAFMDIARRENLTLSVVALGGCPWQRHLASGRYLRACRARKDDAYTRVIPELKPDVIIAVNYGYDDPSVGAVRMLGESGEAVMRGTPEFDHLLREATLASVAELEPMAATGLVIIEPIPVAPKPENPTACLVRGRFLEECRYIASREPSRLERLYRDIAARNPRVWSADFDRLVCPWWPVCDPMVGGHIVKVDCHHLTAGYAGYIAADIADYLKANLLLPAGEKPAGDAVAAAGR